LFVFLFNYFRLSSVEVLKKQLFCVVGACACSQSVAQKEMLKPSCQLLHCIGVG